MKVEPSADWAQWNRSLVMKVGSAVLGVHVAVLCVFALTQGCVTTESEGSARGYGSRHKGATKHKHAGKEDAPAAVQSWTNVEPGLSVIDDSPIISTTPVEPVYVPPVQTSSTYIVQKGDVLSKIAQKFNTTTATLISINNLTNPDVLYVGQELKVPSSGGGSSYTAPAKTSAPSVQKGGTYVIQKGDTLSGIAVAAGVSLKDLRAVNNIQGDRINAGDTIYIPQGGKVPSKKTTATTSSKPKTTKPAPVEPAPVIDEPAPAPAPLAPAPAASAANVDYVEEITVYPDQSLDEIANTYGISKAEIMRMNNISDESAIQAGQRLRIPVSE